MKNLKYIFAIGLVTAILFHSCKKEEEPEVNTNPYNDPSLWPPPDTNKPPQLDSGSFAFLYHHVFSKTCANSGCHDGNFPPDFRTIYSSYNTLVNHPVIQNDAQQTFTNRVEPYSVEHSLIYTRLTVFMPNTSGIMPLALEPDSDWPDNKDIYIQMIAEWIENGAPDIYGTVPSDPDLNPQVVGILAFNAGSTSNPLPRLDNKATNPIIIPKGPVDVWFAFSDDITSPADFTFTQLQSSRNLFDFKVSESFPITISNSIPGTDFWGQSTNFTHKATVNFSSDTNNTFIYLRTYIQEKTGADTVEMPSAGTSELLRSYFTLKVDSL